MFSESKPSIEMTFGSKNELVDFIIKNIPKYTKAELGVPVGDEQTTLSQFLEKANNGSEWTDPHGFKINVVDGQFKVLII